MKILTNHIYLAIYNSDQSLVPLYEQKKYIPGNDNAYFYVESIDNFVQMSIYTAKHPIHEQFADIIIRITDLSGPYGYAKIHITECWLNKICGLCGKYDHIKNNDFMLPLKPTLSEQYISTENVEIACDINQDSWDRTNQFGDSWLDDTIPAISDTV